MTTIVANKIGKVINLLIDGNVYQKKCESNEEADKFFRIVLDAKKGGKKEYDVMMMALNHVHRVLVNGVLETDNTGRFYLQGFSHPVPEILVETINEYLEKDFPVTAIVNFWKLLMLNPDKQVREDLFKFLTQYDFAITDNGYFIAYKVVKTFKTGITDQNLINFVIEHYEKFKGWKKSPKNYCVMHNPTTDKYMAVANGDQHLHKEFVERGNLDELYATVASGVSDTIYTDKYNGTTRIILGQAVQKERLADPHEVECSSNGLHVGSTSYVNNFYNPTDTALMVLINPAHVIHIPSRETTKLRTAEYYPFAILELADGHSSLKTGKFKVLNQPYFETEYANFEKDKIEQELEAIRAAEITMPTKKPDQIDYRKMLEKRLVDLTTILAAEQI